LKEYFGLIKTVTILIHLLLTLPLTNGYISMLESIAAAAAAVVIIIVIVVRWWWRDVLPCQLYSK
jgi:hypothetical protein